MCANRASMSQDTRVGLVSGRPFDRGRPFGGRRATQQSWRSASCAAWLFLRRSSPSRPRAVSLQRGFALLEFHALRSASCAQAPTLVVRAVPVYSALGVWKSANFSRQVTWRIADRSHGGRVRPAAYKARQAKLSNNRALHECELVLPMSSTSSTRREPLAMEALRPLASAKRACQASSDIVFGGLVDSSARLGGIYHVKVVGEQLRDENECALLPRVCWALEVAEQVRRHHGSPLLSSGCGRFAGV